MGEQQGRPRIFTAELREHSTHGRGRENPDRRLVVTMLGSAYRMTPAEADGFADRLREAAAEARKAVPPPRPVELAEIDDAA